MAVLRLGSAGILLALAGITPAWALVSRNGATPEVLSAAELSRLDAAIRKDAERYQQECRHFESEVSRLLPSSQDNRAFESRQKALEALDTLERQPHQGLALRRLVELGRAGALTEAPRPGQAALQPPKLPPSCGMVALFSGIHRLSQYRQDSNLVPSDHQRIVRVALDFVDRLPRELQPASAVAAGSAILMTLAERNLLPHDEAVLRQLRRIRDDAAALAQKTLREGHSVEAVSRFSALGATLRLADRLQEAADRLRPRK